jgi:hypothetical protein
VAGGDGASARRDLESGLDELRRAGLVGRTTAPPEPERPPRAPVVGAHSSAVHGILDEGVRFRSDDRAALAQIDALLGLSDERAATVDLGVDVSADGVRLGGFGAEQSYSSMAELLDALPTNLNRIAATSSTCIALHAGAVRSRDGDVVLLPATSGAGKTTLTAALVAAGWDYGSDEAVGVREGSLHAVAYAKPLVVDGISRLLLGLPVAGGPNVAPPELRAGVEVLRGDMGPVTRVVLPRFEPDAEPQLEPPLAPREALVAVLEHALNLRFVGEPGLRALCQLALRVPVQRLVHGDVDAAAALLR